MSGPGRGPSPELLAREGIEDRRADRRRDAAPAPLARGDLEPFLRARAGGAPLDAAVAALLAALPDTRRAGLGRISKESRGAWTLLLAARPRRALLVGNALSGAALPLAASGAALTLVDGALERLRLARALLVARGVAAPRAVWGGDGPTLPFEDGAFDLVACEEPPDAARLGELARVCAGELFVVAENRAAPLARRPAGPRARRLAGWRAALGAAGLAPTRAVALHPGRDDPAALLGLERGGLAPMGAPRERGPAARALAQRAGLLSLLSRDVGLFAARAPGAAVGTRLGRALAAVAAARGAPPPELEHLVGSCGDTCEAFTRAADGAPGLRAHVATCAEHVPGIERNHRLLERLRAHHPAVPVAAPLDCGAHEGLFLSCERRLPGWAGDQVLRSPAVAARMAAETAALLPHLAAGPARAWGAEELDRHIGPWFDGARAALPDGPAREALEEQRLAARAALAGRAVPRVVVHGDLRAKHVQARADGSVVGFVHWGVALDEGLPGLDLIHLLVHARRQLAGQRDGDAWRALSDPSARHPSERAALEAYAAALELGPEVLPAVLRVYPAFVHAVAFSFSLFAQPGWFEDAFQLGTRR